MKLGHTTKTMHQPAGHLSATNSASVQPDRRKFLLTAGLSLAAAPLLVRSALGASVETTTAETKPLRIGVIGAGWLGGTVGRLWVQAGHEVLFASRHPEELTAMVRELGPHASAGTPRQAAEFGSILLFAVPYEALPQLGRDLQDVIRGKIVLDACNPSAGSNTELAREALANDVGPTSAKYLPGARLVRAFCAVDATAIESSARQSNDKLGVPIAGNDAEALQLAARLAIDAGCEPVVVGNLAAAKTFQRGGPGFRANVTAAELRRLLGLK